MKRRLVRFLPVFAVLAAVTAEASVGADPSDASVFLADVAEGQTETYTEKIPRAYTKFVKTGKGTLVLTAESSKSSSTDFMGTVEIREGIVEAQNYYALKECSYASDSSVVRLSVASNAQLRIAFNAAGQNQNAFYNVGIEGDGPDGKGAIVFNGGGSGDNLIRHLHLTGDASIGGTGRFGIGYWGVLYLDGHVLTGKTNEYFFRDIRCNADHAGDFVKKGGSVTFQRGDCQTYLRGGSGHAFTLDGASLTFWSGTDLDADWTLKLKSATSIFAHGSGQWSGPVVGDGGALDVYSDNANCVFTFGRSITNVTTFRPHNSGGQSYTLSLPGDHYLGSISQNRSHVTISNGQHQVMGAVSLTDGTSSLRFIDAGDVRLTNGESRVYAGTGQSAPARLEFRGRTVVNGESGTRLMVGDHSTASWASDYVNYYGSLTVADGAALTNDLCVGYRGLGAVYQRNAEVYESNGFDIGYGYGNKGGAKAYGYWGSSNSHLTVNGQLRIAAANSTGAFVQRGGLTEIAAGSKFYLSEYGEATLHVLDGGEFRDVAGNGVYFGGSGDGGSASVTVEGEGSLIDFGTKAVSWMVHKNFRTHLNLNDGGTFSCYRIQYESLRADLEASRSYLSFNGGCLRFAASAGTTEYRPFYQWGTPVHESHPDVCTIFAGGAAIDAATTNCFYHFDADLLCPSGLSVASIALPTDAGFASAAHLGALRVVIADSQGGEGASAYVAFDDVTGRPTKVVVTSPGVNYHAGTTTATVMPMRGDAGWDCAVTLAELPGGGLVKKGPGTLFLRGTSTYSGATTVEAGTLRIGPARACPQNRPLVLAGGTLDVATNDVTVASLSGFGGVSGDSADAVLRIAGPLQLTGTDLLAGRGLTFTRLSPVFGDGAAIEVDGTGLPDGTEPLRVVVAESQQPFAGTPSITVPVGWRVSFSADRRRISFARECGLRIILR